MKAFDEDKINFIKNSLTSIVCKFPTLTEDTILLNVTGYNKPLLDIVRKKKEEKKLLD